MGIEMTDDVRGMYKEVGRLWTQILSDMRDPSKVSMSAMFNMLAAYHRGQVFVANDPDDEEKHILKAEEFERISLEEAQREAREAAKHKHDPFGDMLDRMVGALGGKDEFGASKGCNCHACRNRRESAKTKVNGEGGS